jgi:hypothetical protein
MAAERFDTTPPKRLASDTRAFDRSDMVTAKFNLLLGCIFGMNTG